MGSEAGGGRAATGARNPKKKTRKITATRTAASKPKSKTGTKTKVTATRKRSK